MSSSISNWWRHNGPLKKSSDPLNLFTFCNKKKGTWRCFQGIAAALTQTNSWIQNELFKGNTGFKNIKYLGYSGRKSLLECLAVRNQAQLSHLGVWGEEGTGHSVQVLWVDLEADDAEVTLICKWRDCDCFTLVAARQVVTDIPVHIILTKRRTCLQKIPTFTVITMNVLCWFKKTICQNLEESDWHFWYYQL